MAQELNFPDVVPRLQGDLVYLREVSEQDIPAWYARATDVESAWLAGVPFQSRLQWALIGSAESGRDFAPGPVFGGR